MTQNNTLIMKFGGASVETLNHFHQVAAIVTQRQHDYENIVVVISAMHGMTDQLINLAFAVNPAPPRREYDMLVTVGERISCSLLAMALASLNCSAVSLTGSQAGIITSEEHSDAKIVDVRPHRLISHLKADKVLVVAGFQGVSRSGEITTLGRGGSDTTAVALAIALQADVEFYKDVSGIFDEDPKNNPQAVHYSRLSYEEALQVVARTGNVLHPRCIQLAALNNIPLQVLSFHSVYSPSALKTVISAVGARSPVPRYEECSLQQQIVTRT